MIGFLNRGVLRRKSRRTRDDETVHTKPPLAKRKRDRKRRAGELKRPVLKTPPLPEGVREREWAKKTPEQREKVVAGRRRAGGDAA